METPTQTPNTSMPTYTMPPVAPQVTPPPMPPVPPPVERPPVVPPSYIPPTMPSAPEGRGSEARMILPALLLVLIIGGAYYWYASRTDTAPYVPKTATTTRATVTGMPAPGVEVAKADISTGSAKKLPDGFPASVPVELGSITESYKAVYADHGVTQYTVSYTSKKSTDDLWKIFTTYLTSASYKTDTANTSKALGSMRGTKDKGEISVVITSANGGTLVQVSLLERQ